MGIPTSDDSDRPLDAVLADAANNICGIIEGCGDPALVASRLSALGWRTWSASWCSYEAGTSWCRIEIDPVEDETALINGVVAPERLDDLATLLGGFGWRHSFELSDENGIVVEERCR